jgi:hypothetical protein
MGPRGCSSLHDCQGSTSRRFLTRIRGFHSRKTKKMVIALHIYLSNFDAWKYGGRHILRMPLYAVSALESYNFNRKCRSNPQDNQRLREGKYQSDPSPVFKQTEQILVITVSLRPFRGHKDLAAFFYIHLRVPSRYEARLRYPKSESLGN